MKKVNPDAMDKSVLMKTESIYDFTDVTLEKRANFLNRILVISDEGIGSCQTHYSKQLLKSHLREQIQSGMLPQAIVLLNRGVLLGTSNSIVLEELRALESQGVLILSNISCLEFHKALDQIVVGGVSTMGNVVELMNLAKSVIYL